MLCAIEMGWFVLDKYYRMTDEVPVFATALLLDPSRRAAYLRKNWPKAWVKPAIDAASKLWEDNFETRETDPSPAPLSMPPPETPSKKHGTELDKLMKDMDVTTEEESQDKDDFVAFTESTAVRIDCTPLEWWCRAEKRKNCPRLSRMAITILSIPAESSEPERTFSGTRRTCSWDRLRLSCLNIQKIESIGNWIREGHIRPLHLNGMGLPMGPAVEGDVDELDNEAMDETEYI